MRPPRLIAFDLDGTTLDHGIMSRATARALNDARGRGCLLAVATGRSYVGLNYAVSGIACDYIISSNGARITAEPAGAVIAQQCLSRASVQGIFALLSDCRCAFSAQMQDAVIFERGQIRKYISRGAKLSAPQLLTLLRFQKSIKRVKSIPALLALRADAPEKLTVHPDDGAELPRILERITAAFPVEAAVFNDEIEMTARGVSKGAALSSLAGALGIKKEDILAFGDSGNDLSMAPAAGRFVAVGNATADVLRLADEVAPPVEADGVAVYLERLFSAR
ncbi:MAG: HAD family hydrolase [Oscillospiraceae bacterium]|nr:HAD family hydrolase [Oscillospiraceae bacterium]